MSIRLKLFLFFTLTLLLLSGISLYTVSVYRDILNTEQQITSHLRNKIELSHRAESFFNQLKSWKNILLRGNDAGNYHQHLQGFYQAERDTRNIISKLQTAETQDTNVSLLLEQ